MHKLLENWGFDKLNQHFMDVQKFYQEKRDVMLKTVEKHLSGKQILKFEF